VPILRVEVRDDNQEEDEQDDVHSTNGDHGNVSILQLTLELASPCDDVAFLIDNVVSFNIIVVLDRWGGRFRLVLDLGGRHDGERSKSREACLEKVQGPFKENGIWKLNDKL
jgi:hypothetical protein